MVKSCAYGEVTREMVNEIKDKIDKLDCRMTELFNHQSSRLPLWVTILFTILGSLVTGLIILILK